MKKIIKFLAVILLLSSPVAYSFTHTDNWSIPDNQKCDHWNSVSYYVPALNPVIHEGESRKIIIRVPENSVHGEIAFKGHASKPSWIMTNVNHDKPFYIEPKLGNNVSQAFNHPKDYLYIYQNHINNKLNAGPSTVHHMAITFKLRQEECDVRKGHPTPHRIVIPDLKVKPIILRKDFSFHLNQLDLGKGSVYSVQFIFDRESDGHYYFRTGKLRPVTVDDYDNDSYTVLGGDCNDDNPGINPGAGNCN